jgi:phage gpG-like protein
MSTTVPKRPVRTELIEDPRYLGGVFQQIENGFNGADHTDVLHGVATDLAEDHAGFFARAQDPGGNPWPALSPRTVAHKGHSTILVDTTSMRASLLSPGHPDHVQDVESRFLVWGTSDEKGPLHMSGTSRMPARPFVGVTDQRADAVANLVADSVIEQMKG